MMRVMVVPLNTAPHRRLSHMALIDGADLISQGRSAARHGVAAGKAPGEQVSSIDGLGMCAHDVSWSMCAAASALVLAQYTCKTARGKHGSAWLPTKIERG